MESLEGSTKIGQYWTAWNERFISIQWIGRTKPPVLDCPTWDSSLPSRVIRPGRVDCCRRTDGLPRALAFMETRAEAIRAGTAGECVWLVEHPPLYTAGTSADAKDLITPDRFPVYPAGRGGEYTYHGPGQRVAYVMLDLKRRKEDVRVFVAALETWIIRALDQFNIKGEVRE